MKLPVLSVVLVAYQILFANLGAFFRLVLIPFLVCSLGEILTLFLGAQLDEGADVIFSIIAYGIQLVGWLSTIPSITAWHRLVILGADNPTGRIRYAIGVTERAYLWKAVLLYIAMNAAYVIAAMGIAMTVGAVLWKGGILVAFDQVLPTVAWLVGLLATTAFLLVLPGAAIGQNLSLRSSVSAVRGNVLRLFAIYLIAAAPEYLLLQILWAVYPSDAVEPSMGFAVGYIFVDTFVVFCFFTITISVLSVAYKLLVFSNQAENEIKAT
jgi:hypothetical protein